MKAMILAALALLSLSAGAAEARSLFRGAPAHPQAGNQYNWSSGGA